MLLGSGDQRQKLTQGGLGPRRPLVPTEAIASLWTSHQAQVLQGPQDQVYQMQVLKKSSPSEQEKQPPK